MCKCDHDGYSSGSSDHVGSVLKHPKRGPYAANKTDDKKKLRDEISRNRVLRMKIATLTRWNQRSLESALSDTKQIIELLENYDVDLSD